MRHSTNPNDFSEKCTVCLFPLSLALNLRKSNLHDMNMNEHMNPPEGGKSSLLFKSTLDCSLKRLLIGSLKINVKVIS